MTTLKKLQINGFRAFDPDSTTGNVIEFFCPLTIIVGQNGCGKTTIIEALKYVITNEHPPGSSKGATFVYDPKLCNNLYRVLAKVKLEVIDSKGDSITVTRRVSAIRDDKKANVTMKTLDATINKISADGMPVQLNSKCADLNEYICQVMGVTEPIINNVMLCHQEDSTWPLDEGKKVKERFDAIFNTSAYNKIEDQLYKKEKEIGERAKQGVQLLEYATQNKKMLEEKRSELIETGAKIQSANDQVEKYEKEMRELDVKIRKLTELNRSHTDLNAKVAQKQAVVSMLESQIKESLKNIKSIFQGDVETLKVRIENFEEEIKGQSNELKETEKSLNEKENEMSRFNVSKSEFHKKEGIFSQKKKVHDVNLGEMKTLKKEIIEKLKKHRENSDQSLDSSFSDAISALLDSNEDVESDVVVRAINSSIRSKDLESDKMKIKLEAQENEFKKLVDTAREKLANQNTEISMSVKRMMENKKEINEFKDKLANIETSNDLLTDLEKKEKKLNEKIESIEGSKLIEKNQEAVESLNIEIKELDGKIKQLSETVDLLSKDKSKLDKREIFQKQKEGKERDMREIVNSSKDTLNELLGTFEEDASSMDKLLKKKIDEIGKDFTLKDKELKDKSKQSYKLEADFNQITKELQDKEKELDEWRDKQLEELDDKPFDSIFEETIQELETTNDKRHFNKAAQYLYKQYIKRLQEKPCCPLCKTDFPDQRRAHSLKTSLETQISTMETQTPSLNEKYAKLTTKQKTLYELKPVVDKMEVLEKTTIPQLKTKKNDLKSKVETLKETIEELNDQLSVLGTDRTLGNGIVSKIERWVSIQNETKKLADEINKVDLSRDPNAKDSPITLSNAKSQYDELQNTISLKRQEKENKENARDKSRNELSTSQTEKNSIRAKILQITADLQNRESYEEQKTKLEVDNKEISERVSELKLNIPSIKSEIESAESNKKNVTDEKEAKLNSIRIEKDCFEKLKRKIIELKRDIENYQESVNEMIEHQRRFGELNVKIEESQGKIKELSKKRDFYKNEISSANVLKRDLLDNMDVKMKEAEIAVKKTEFVELTRALTASSNKQLVDELNKAEQDYSDMMKKKSEIIGSRKENILSKDRLGKELKEKYANTDEDFIEKLARVKVYQKAKMDLGLYRAYLHKAVLSFHNKRMQAINRVLKELWRKVYKGNDIDYIQIRTSEEHDSRQGENVINISSRNQYNYRVVMIRRDIEMDMRNRCSAGQKVLASIIIRIALAETFSAKCGIIALDEPTTNLDQKNIDALGETLASIALSMRNSKTFQLIVITHDTKFMEKLIRVDPVENYYEVSRDPRGHSKIKQCDKSRLD